MNEVVLRVENLSKVYRLGEIGTGTISHDLNRWWAKFRGKEDPFSKVGVANDRSQKGKKGEYVKVLDDISFEVKRGEVLGIIGKNGAGKSTLLKVISQITSPSSGSIKAKGRIASLLEVGTGMHPEMTGKENVYLNGTILGMTKKEIDSKFEEIMEFAGCFKYADTPVKRYSSGMKVRLGFAVAAFLEPEILIVDEVLAVGDAEFQKKAIGKIHDISAGDGRTVLFVSHNMRSIKSICSRIVLLDKGKISKIGNVEEVINTYLSHGNSNFDSQYCIEETKNNPDISISEVLIRDKEGNHLDAFQNDQEIVVRVKINVKSSIKFVTSYMSVLDENESVIFRSTDYNSADGKYYEGTYWIENILPKGIFNERKYSVSFGMGVKDVKWIFGEIIIGHFNVAIINNPTVPNHFGSRWAGVIAPTTEWRIDRIKN